MGLIKILTAYRNGKLEQRLLRSKDYHKYVADIKGEEEALFNRQKARECEEMIKRIPVPSGLLAYVAYLYGKHS